MSADQKIRKIKGVAQAMRTAVIKGAEAYANGAVKRGVAPIVSRHFTAGNQQRYGWAPLSAEHFERKSMGIAEASGAAHFLDAEQARTLKAGSTSAVAKSILLAELTKGRTGSTLDKAAQSNFSTHAARGLGVSTGVNLPMLVFRGLLKAAMTGVKHAISQTGNGQRAVIHFRNLPEYAQFLHEGTATMPKRSPVEPNAEDRAAVLAVMQKHMDAAMRTGGKVPVSSGPIPGRARFV